MFISHAEQKKKKNKYSEELSGGGRGEEAK